MAYVGLHIWLTINTFNIYIEYVNTGPID